VPLFDYYCPDCRRTTPDYLVRDRYSLVECSTCGQEMQRQIGLPSPAIWHTGGRGG